MAGDDGIEIYEEEEKSMDVNKEAEVKTELEKGGGYENVLQFLDSLDGWASKGGSGKGKDFSTDADSEIGSPIIPQLRHRGVSEDKQSAKDETILAADKEIKKERAKLFSIFGGLFSPKLRGAQLSFETALETLMEIANA